MGLAVAGDDGNDDDDERRDGEDGEVSLPRMEAEFEDGDRGGGVGDGGVGGRAGRSRSRVRSRSRRLPSGLGPDMLAFFSLFFSFSLPLSFDRAACTRVHAL